MVVDSNRRFVFVFGIVGNVLFFRRGAFHLFILLVAEAIERAEIAMNKNSDSEISRRPIKARDWSLFQKIASLLARLDVTPNAISVASILFGIIAGVLLAATSQIDSSLVRSLLFVGSAVASQMRLIANLLDGMVAIEQNRRSSVGELFNEVPDRISDPAILIGAGFAFGSHPLLGFSAALAAMFVAYVRAIGASTGVGQIFLGPFAKPQRMVVLMIASVASAILPVHWQVHSACGYGIFAAALALIVVGCSLTAVRRLLRIASLMRSSNEKAESSNEKAE